MPLVQNLLYNILLFNIISTIYSKKKKFFILLIELLYKHFDNQPLRTTGPGFPYVAAKNLRRRNQKKCKLLYKILHNWAITLKKKNIYIGCN